jgi:hypothetical protein
MTRLFFCFVVLCLSLCPSVFADDALKLSGIMNGVRPTAIVNDQIVAVGDSIDGFQVFEIGADYVVCQNKKGNVELRLKQDDVAVVKPKAVSLNTVVPKDIKAPEVSKTQSTNNREDLQARKYLDRSIEYLKQGDALLKSPLAFERLYSKAADFCDNADREAQAAFRSVTGEAFRAGIKEHIDRVRQAKQAILKEKANFNTRVKSMIAAHQIITGMTQRDAVSSWGAPLMQNRDGGVEKWVYQDNNGYQKELVFKDGILVGY